MRAFASVIAATTLLTALAAAPAAGDVGFESASRRSGSPGDRVEVTIGCGFCFPPCVGVPGHRHPRGGMGGPCMLGARGRPPASFQVWLTRLRHPLGRHVCGAAESCPFGARPPRLPSFTYLGRALPLRFPEGVADRRRYEPPRYRLIFAIPEVRPGRYKYVLFCEICVDGPRGSLIGPGTAAGRLRVVARDASAEGAAGALPWIAAGALAAILALGAGVRLRAGGTKPHAGRAG